MSLDQEFQDGIGKQNAPTHLKMRTLPVNLLSDVLIHFKFIWWHPCPQQSSKNTALMTTRPSWSPHPYVFDNIVCPYIKNCGLNGVMKSAPTVHEHGVYSIVFMTSWHSAFIPGRMKLPQATWIGAFLEGFTDKSTELTMRSLSACEHCWSIEGWIHSKRRNRLSQELV